MPQRRFSIFQEFALWSDLPLTIKFKKHENTTERHFHPDFFELVFVRSGKAFNQLDDRKFAIAAGDFFLLPAKICHCYKHAQGLEIYNILFRKEMLSYAADDLKNFAVYHILFNPLNVNCQIAEVLHLPDDFYPETLRLLEDILSEQQLQSSGSRTAVFSGFLRLLLTFCRFGTLAGKNRIPSCASTISQLLNRLDKEYFHHWDLHSMAESCRMSPSSFRQQFTSITAMPPVTYLLDLRLRKSLIFLSSGKYSVAEAAAKCGFNDSNYFARQFRKKFGIAPRELKLSDKLQVPAAVL